MAKAAIIGAAPLDTAHIHLIFCCSGLRGLPSGRHVEMLLAQLAGLLHEQQAVEVRVLGCRGQTDLEEAYKWQAG